MLSPIFVNKIQESVVNGTSKNFVRLMLLDICERATPLSVELCVSFLKRAYDLDTIADDKERGIQLSYVYGMYA